jgi:hypothetical protein
MKKPDELESGIQLGNLFVEDLLPQQEERRGPHEKLMLRVRPMGPEWDHLGLDEYERRE